MKNYQKTLLLVLGLAVILPLGAFLLTPVPANPPNGNVDGFRGAVFATMLLCVLDIGAAALFLQGLDGFKEQLKRAYRFICLALVVAGLAQLEYPVFGTFNLWLHPVITGYGILAWPGLIGAVLLFLGLRSFAEAMQDKSPWLSPAILAVALLVGVAGGVLLDVPYRVEACLACAVTVVGLANIILVLRIKAATGAAYTSALAWFSLALLCNMIGLAGSTTFDVLHITRGAILVVPSTLAAVLFVKAGYAFNKIKDY